jgi:hypothetical protein
MASSNRPGTTSASACFTSATMVARLRVAYPCAQNRSRRYARISGVPATNTARSGRSALCGSFRATGHVPLGKLLADVARA